uniref:Uncharacterized protein n=1 Tax=Ceramothamnion japonicum TaxID=218448 RepID=A0A1C9CDC3_CERJP|nr:hypothetical protein Ceram_115 [Ceramium japonicum]AOM66391.1 hypothetical protein Ceram_115 [Ceramium japonicum]
MECINLNNGLNIVHNMSMGFVVQFTHLKEVWLFNSFDGCQHIILKKGIKINQISKIIIRDLKTNTIAGLLGILSSLSLSHRKESVHIYGPLGLEQYIDLGKKYSHTNFCYNIYLYVLTPGIIIDHWSCKVYIMMKCYSFTILLFTHVKPGKFEISKAQDFRIISGPLYGKLKKGLDFIAPDGFILDGNNFICNNYVGIKNSIFFNIYNYRQSVENMPTANILIYSL